jgi:hypothetical protein
MRTRLVECLNCGAARRVAIEPARPAHPDDCPRCGYVGWAEAETLTESLRRALRETRLEQRRRTPIATW